MKLELSPWPAITSLSAVPQPLEALCRTQTHPHFIGMACIRPYGIFSSPLSATSDSFSFHVTGIKTKLSAPIPNSASLSLASAYAVPLSIFF